MNQGYRIVIALFALLAIGPPPGSVGSSQPAAQAIDARRQRPALEDGQSATLLPDGTWLVTGGIRQGGGAVGTASIWDPTTGETAVIRGGLEYPRLGHTATLMRDGRVLILGGIDARGALESTAEYYDPKAQRFRGIALPVQPRAFHSATLLTDGRLLVAGGVGAGGELRSDAEILEPRSNTVEQIGMNRARRGHQATLLDDGSIVIVGGVGDDGKPVAADEVYFPASGSFVAGAANPIVTDAVILAGSQPDNGATDVPVDAWIGLRFSSPVRVRTLNVRTVTLASAEGDLEIAVTPAEEGRLVFLRPTKPLQAATRYTVLISGAIADGNASNPLTPTGISFTTAGTDPAVKPVDDEEWTPGVDAFQRGWKSDRPDSPWRQLPPMQAAPGTTALAGQALLLNGKPLADVTLELDGHVTRTDRTGRFLLLLQGMASGHEELRIDGTTASRPGRTYGVFEARVRLVTNTTMVLPYTIWMPKIDTAHAVTIPSPTTEETIVTTPSIPGLELHLAKGTVIRGEDGQVVRQLSITPIPVDRPPFPLPQNSDVPIYFTIQPGGAYVHVYGNSITKVASLVYPNYTNRNPGTRMDFWHYDADSLRGWNVYGQGSVDATGTRVIPDPGIGIYEFTGAMILDGSWPSSWPDPWGGPPRGDPVDLGTGLFVYQKTDLFLPDVIPIALTRTYRPGDSVSRAFGMGSTNPYAITLYSTENYEWADLILPDGGRIYYERTSPGTGFLDAVYEHTSTPSPYFKSQLFWSTTDGGWNLRLKDGTVLVFGDNAPLQRIRDRFGNTLRIEHSNGTIGNVTRVLSPHNRWITFAYDGSNRITQATDNLGRSVGYTYDASGRLWKVTDALGGVTEFTYDTSNRMLTVKDARNIVYLTNAYDSNGRVSQQTQADSGILQFSYTLSSGKVVQTDVTDPEGHIQRTTFNGDGYPTSQVEAVGTALERTTIFTRVSGSNLLASTQDALSRETNYTYDSNGSLTSIVRLVGTADETTTAISYEPIFNQVATLTDALSHTTTLSYDSAGHVTKVTDPLSHETSFTYNPAGQVVTVTNALNQTTTFGYDLGDLVSITNPQSQTTTRFFDGAGRLVGTTNPLGQTAITEYNAVNQITKIIDPIGGQTTFTYDGNGNLLTLTDARGKITSWAYDDMDRVQTRTNPLSREEGFAYDLDGLLTASTDRKGQVTTTLYDALHRRTFIGFDTTGTPASYESSTTSTYDAGNRLTQIADSLAGTINFTYELSDRVAEEETPEGTISYTYDAAGRRSSMTVDGQTSVSYSYDNADRLTGITQGSAAVAVTYDATDRRTSLTLPNGVVVEYTYDSASRLSDLAYKLTGATFGNLAYTYDAAGRRTTTAGSYARSGLPAALTSATYDDANEIATFGGTTFSYDENGNLTSDGSKTYTWNARNELIGISGTVSATFGYDALGRRRAKTIGGSTTQFLYDGLNPVQELSGGSPVANLLTGLDVDEFFTRDDGATRYYLSDALGNSVALADSSGAVQTEYTYEPFGGTGTSGSSTSNTFGFTGRENDGSGLAYYRARYYDPRLQRFIGEDPLGLSSGDVNQYAYVSNSPIQASDPTGLIKVAVPAGSACSPPPPGRKITLADWLRYIACVTPILPFPLIAPDVPPIVPPLPHIPDGSCGAGGGPGGGSSSGGNAPGDDPTVVSPPGSGNPKMSPNFQPPTNPPQMPPGELQPGYRIRHMPPAPGYPDGYWKMEKQMNDGSWQPIDPSTGKPGGRPQTHVPFPPKC